MSMFLTCLDPMAVQTQELGVVALAGDDFLVELDPVLARAFLAPSAEDVIDVQHPHVFDSTPSARTAQS